MRFAPTRHFHSPAGACGLQRCNLSPRGRADVIGPRGMGKARRAPERVCIWLIAERATSQDQSMPMDIRTMQRDELDGYEAESRRQYDLRAITPDQYAERRRLILERRRDLERGR
jgi:hypothetical protein